MNWLKYFDYYIAVFLIAGQIRDLQKHVEALEKELAQLQLKKKRMSITDIINSTEKASILTSFMQDLYLAIAN